MKFSLLAVQLSVSLFALAHGANVPGNAASAMECVLNCTNETALCNVTNEVLERMLHFIRVSAPFVVGNDMAERILCVLASLSITTVCYLFDSFRAVILADSARGFPLHELAKHGFNLDKFESLKSQVNSIDDLNEYGRTALQEAISHGNMALVEALIGENANVNLTHGDQYLPIVIAALSGNVQIFDLLVKKNASIDPFNFPVSNTEDSHDNTRPLGAQAQDSLESGKAQALSIFENLAINQEFDMIVRILDLTKVDISDLKVFGKSIRDRAESCGALRLVEALDRCNSTQTAQDGTGSNSDSSTSGVHNEHTPVTMDIDVSNEQPPVARDIAENVENVVGNKRKQAEKKGAPVGKKRKQTKMRSRRSERTLRRSKRARPSHSLNLSGKSTRLSKNI